MNTVPHRKFTARIDRRRKKVIVYATIITALFTYFVPGSKIKSSRRTTSVVSDDDRPIMHTFYHKVNSGENDLLEAWKEEWDMAGFKPVVLNLENAKKHPYFEEMEKVMKDLFEDIDAYNRMCYYRWLAMAASGGGWMSDYDTFPTNFPMDESKTLPNGGNFTAFQSQVPSLIVGSADEWLRVTKLLMAVIPRTPYKLKSDMHAFVVIMHEGTHNIDFSMNVAKGFIYKKAHTADSPREVDCDRMSFGKAIHFAHVYCKWDYDAGKYPVNVTSMYEVNNHRGQAARIFMADWRKQCGGSNVGFPMRDA